MQADDRKPSIHLLQGLGFVATETKIECKNCASEAETAIAAGVLDEVFKSH